MSDRFQELMVFVRAAETGSFSRTARELRLSQPSVSRIINALEERLEVKLLLRTTRRINLSDAGVVFLERARRALAELGEAEDAARGLDSLLGVLRIAMPVMYGTREIIPRLPKFLQENPLLRIEMTVSDARQDLVAEAADVAIRVGALDDSSFGARRLASLDRILVAAPDYIHLHGVPNTPSDLAAHDCIFGPGGFVRDSWKFRRDGTLTTVEVQGRIHTDSWPCVFSSALAGLGVAMASTVMCGPEIERGELVRLLPDYTLDAAEVNAVFPSGRRPSAKVRAFVDFLVREFAAAP